MFIRYLQTGEFEWDPLPWCAAVLCKALSRGLGQCWTSVGWQAVACPGALDSSRQRPRPARCSGPTTPALSRSRTPLLARLFGRVHHKEAGGRPGCDFIGLNYYSRGVRGGSCEREEPRGSRERGSLAREGCAGAQHTRWAALRTGGGCLLFGGMPLETCTRAVPGCPSPLSLLPSLPALLSLCAPFAHPPSPAAAGDGLEADAVVQRGRGHDRHALRPVSSALQRCTLSAVC